MVFYYFYYSGARATRPISNPNREDSSPLLLAPVFYGNPPTPERKQCHENWEDTVNGHTRSHLLLLGLHDINVFLLEVRVPCWIFGNHTFLFLDAEELNINVKHYLFLSNFKLHIRLLTTCGK